MEIEDLLEYIEMIFTRKINEKTFLDVVKNEKNIFFLEHLINNGIDINVDNSVALAISIEDGDTKLAKFLLDNGSNTVFKHNSKAITKAVFYNRPEIVSFLLKREGLSSSDHYFLLILAASENYLNIVKILVEGISEDVYRTVFETAIKYNHVQIAKFMIEYNSVLTADDLELALRNSVVDEFVGTVELLIEKGVNIDHSEALIPALRSKNKIIIDLLFANGANPSINGNRNISSLKRILNP
jgi:ankyrin repeat protein